jgi:predicted Zn-dependent protease
MLPAGQLMHIALPCSGHPAMFFLAQTGLLGDTCLRVLRDGVAPDTAQLFQRRRNSSHWHFTLAQMCLARRKFRFGLRAIDAAIEREPRMAHAHLVRVRLLARAGRSGAAIAAARRTLDTVPVEPWMQTEFTQIARRQQDRREAKSAVGDAGRPPAFNPAAAAYRPVPPPAPP